MVTERPADVAPPSSPEDECRIVLDSIRRVVQLLRRSANLSEKHTGLSAAQIFVLHKLAGVTSLSVGDLAKRTLTSQSSVSEVVQKLVSRGYVTRVRSTRDARSVELSLTDGGREVIEKAPVAPQDLLLGGLRNMPPRDRRQLARLLGRLVEETGVVGVSPHILFEDEVRPAHSTATSSQLSEPPLEAPVEASTAREHEPLN